MARAPAAGRMRTFVEYGKDVPTFGLNGGFTHDFKKEGEFWAEKMTVGSSERGDIVRTVAGVDISDDITTLRTWTGHPVTTEHRLRVSGAFYSMLGIAESNDGRTIDYRATSGLRDTKG